MHPPIQTDTMGFGRLSRPGISTNLWQLVRYKPFIFESFNISGILSSAVQCFACKKTKLAGKFWIDLRFLQRSNLKSWSFERPPKLADRLSKLLHLKSKIWREHKFQRSTGIASFDKLHSQRHKCVSEFNPCSTVGSRMTNLGLVLGDIQDQKSEGNGLDSDPLHPYRDKYSRFFSRTIQKGTCLIAVLSARRIVNDCISPKLSAKLSILEHLERIRVSKDFNL
jgi:hypothetical protein